MRSRPWLIITGLVVSALCAAQLARFRPVTPRQSLPAYAHRGEPTRRVRPAIARSPVLVGSLRSRHRTLHLYSDGKCSIESPDGETLADRITQREMAELYPHIQSELRTYLAAARADSRREFDEPGVLYSGLE